MKFLKALLNETYRNEFLEGDEVATALGNGTILKIEKRGTPDEHILFRPSLEAQEEFNLEDKPYRMNYSEIIKHL